MTEKFRNKYRIASSRLPGYDYSRNGAYFITICTKNRKCLFGDIIVVETGLRPVSTTIIINPINPINNIPAVYVKLSDAGKIVSDCWYDLPNHYAHLILDQFIVMPDHIHGIMIIQNYSGLKHIHGISEFIRAFKSFSSRRINAIRHENKSGTWQSRYYDHIIRSDNELKIIRDYIKNNPYKWVLKNRD